MTKIKTTYNTWVIHKCPISLDRSHILLNIHIMLQFPFLSTVCSLL